MASLRLYAQSRLVHFGHCASMSPLTCFCLNARHILHMNTTWYLLGVDEGAGFLAFIGVVTDFMAEAACTIAKRQTLTTWLT